MEIDDFEFCEYKIEYGGDLVSAAAFAQGLWVEDIIKYNTFLEKTAYRSLKASFGYIYK